MTYPISVVKAQSKPYADMIFPVDGKVEIVLQYDAVLDAVNGQDPSQSDYLRYAMLPPGTVLGEELTVLFYGTSTNVDDYKSLLLGIVGPASTSAEAFQFQVHDLYHVATRKYLFFDGTMKAPGQPFVVFLKWTDSGWFVTARSPGVSLTDNT